MITFKGRELTLTEQRFLMLLQAEVRDRGLKPQDLAARLDCSAPNVWQFLHGKCGVTLLRAEEIAAAAGFPLEAVFLSAATCPNCFRTGGRHFLTCPDSARLRAVEENA